MNSAKKRSILGLSVSCTAAVAAASSGGEEQKGQRM